MFYNVLCVIPAPILTFIYYLSDDFNIYMRYRPELSLVLIAYQVLPRDVSQHQIKQSSGQSVRSSEALFLHPRRSLRQDNAPFCRLFLEELSQMQILCQPYFKNKM